MVSHNDLRIRHYFGPHLTEKLKVKLQPCYLQLVTNSLACSVIP